MTNDQISFGRNQGGGVGVVHMDVLTGLVRRIDRGVVRLTTEQALADGAHD